MTSMKYDFKVEQTGRKNSYQLALSMVFGMNDCIATYRIVVIINRKFIY